MKKIIFGLVGLFIVSQFMVSCGSQSDILGQFSKRKYLKKYKQEKKQDDINIDEIEFSTQINRINQDKYSSKIKIETDVDKTDIEIFEPNIEDVVIASTKDFTDYMAKEVIKNNEKLILPDTIYHVNGVPGSTKRTVHWTTWTAFITGLIGVPASGIIFGIIALYITISEKEKYKGIGWAIFGILFGIYWSIIILLVVGL